MAVEDGLAVLDQRREAARRDRLPAFRRGQFERGIQDELIALCALTFFAFLIDMRIDHYRWIISCQRYIFS